MPPNSRHPPSANPPPAAQHPAYNAMPAGFQNIQNLYPNTATQADLQHILRLVNELAEINSNNRKETNLLIEGVQQMAVKQKDFKSANTTDDQNGEDSVNSVDSAEHILLQNKHADLSRRYDQQYRIIVRYADILSDYEDTMRSMMVRVREFANAHTTTLLQWHKYYNSLLQEERDEKHELFCENSKKEEILAAAREKLSETKSHMLECELPWMRQVAYLKAENKFLRQRLGAPYDKETDSDEENNVNATDMRTGQNSSEEIKLNELYKTSFDAIQEQRHDHRVTQATKRHHYECQLQQDGLFAMEDARRKRYQTLSLRVMQDLNESIAYQKYPEALLQHMVNRKKRADSLDDVRPRTRPRYQRRHKSFSGRDRKVTIEERSRVKDMDGSYVTTVDGLKDSSTSDLGLAEHYHTHTDAWNEDGQDQGQLGEDFDFILLPETSG